MKNKICWILIVMFLCIVISPIANTTVYADNQDRQALISSAKYALALFVIAKLGGVIFDDDEQSPSSQPSAPQAPSSPSSPYQSRDRQLTGNLAGKVIVIDPGHGGYDPGAVGSAGIKEKDLNLDVALMLYDILQLRTDAKLFLTRSTDKFITLSNRTQLARHKKADVFLSIHHNSDVIGEKHGIETYVHHNASQSTWALADHIQRSLTASLGFVDRGILVGNFQVIRQLTDRNALLLELGYLSNQSEAKLLNKTVTKQKAAQAIYEGIIRYFNTQK